MGMRVSYSDSHLCLNSSVSQPNVENLIHAVSLLIYKQVLESANRKPSKSKFAGDFDEVLYIEKRLKKLQQGSDEHAALSSVLRASREDLSLTDVTSFLMALHEASDCSPECFLLCLLYLNRIASFSEVRLDAKNWRALTLTGLVVAQKVWDDKHLSNSDFCFIYRVYQLDDLNKMEAAFLRMLRYQVTVRASTYARYYFELRAMMFNIFECGEQGGGHQADYQTSAAGRAAARRRSRSRGGDAGVAAPLRSAVSRARQESLTRHAERSVAASHRSAHAAASAAAFAQPNMPLQERSVLSQTRRPIVPPPQANVAARVGAAAATSSSISPQNQQQQREQQPPQTHGQAKLARNQLHSLPANAVSQNPLEQTQSSAPQQRQLQHQSQHSVPQHSQPADLSHRHAHLPINPQPPDTTQPAPHPTGGVVPQHSYPNHQTHQQHRHPERRSQAPPLLADPPRPHGGAHSTHQNQPPDSSGWYTQQQSSSHGGGQNHMTQGFNRAANYQGHPTPPSHPPGAHQQFSGSTQGAPQPLSRTHAQARPMQAPSSSSAWMDVIDEGPPGAVSSHGGWGESIGSFSGDYSDPQRAVGGGISGAPSWVHQQQQQQQQYLHEASNGVQTSGRPTGMQSELSGHWHAQ